MPVILSLKAYQLWLQGPVSQGVQDLLVPLDPLLMGKTACSAQEMLLWLDLG
jgi:hypothetical protein